MVDGGTALSRPVEEIAGIDGVNRQRRRTNQIRARDLTGAKSIPQIGGFNRLNSGVQIGHLTKGVGRPIMQLDALAEISAASFGRFALLCVPVGQLRRA